MAYRIQCGICDINNVFLLVLYIDQNLVNDRSEGIELRLEITGRMKDPPKTIN